MPSHLIGPVKFVPNNDVLINKEDNCKSNNKKIEEVIGKELGLHFKSYPVDDDYELLNDLGSGQFAFVKKVRNRKTGQYYAAKFIKKRRFSTSRRGVPRPHIEREIEILKLVGGHKNVIQLYNVYETTDEIILILELINGGELFDHVCEKECLPEGEAVAFVKQILEGVNHLHNFKVCHLDIKPENIMLLKKGEPNIKLIDFGLSRVILPGYPVKDMIGTPEFVAPEVINYEYLSPATDMWAIGVVTYILLSNGSPFLGESREETFCNITAANYHLSDRYFGKVSMVAKDFIKKLLVINQEDRMTASQSLEHPWIRGYFKIDTRKILKNIDNNRKFVDEGKCFDPREYWKKVYHKIRFINRLTMKVRREIEESKASDLTINTKYDPLPMEEQEEYVISAVLVACEEGNLVGLEQLVIRHEINLNVANKLGETSMHIASGAGHDKVVMYLRSQNVPVDVKDRRGDTPLIWAARNGHNNIIKILCKDKNVNINHVNKSGETALHVATRYSQSSSVQILLENGGNPNIQDEHGESPLHIASWHGYSNSLDILCKYKPNLKLANQDDETALHCAAARGHLECVQSLLDCGASVDGRDQTGQTALHLALRRSHIDIALLLITKGCNLDIQDENGDSPLHVACRLGLISAVQTLCHIGASIDLRNIHSLTPLHIAAKEGDIEIVRCLILAGADVNCLTKNGETAESIALLQDNLPLSNLLSKMKSTSNKNLYIDQLIPLEGPLKRIKLKLFGHSGSGKTKLISAWNNTGVINQFFGVVSKRFSDNLSLTPHSSNSTSIGAISFNSTEEGYHSCGSSTSSSMSEVLQHNNNFQKNPSDSTNINGSNNKNFINNSNGNSNSSNNNSNNNNINNNTSPVYFNQPAHPNYTRGIDVQNVNINGAGEFSIWEFGGYEPYHIAYDHFVGNTDCIHVVVFNSQDPTEVQYKQVLYWMNFLKGRVTPSEPIGHCGIVSRRSKVIIVGTNATNSQFTKKNTNGEYISSDLDAMLKTVTLRFETHFDIHESIILLDSSNNNCPGMKSLKNYLRTSREYILNRLQRPLTLLDTCLSHLTTMRKHYENFPVISWPHFTTIIRNELNPLASDSHSRQLIQQLQLIGEVVYLRDESSELDYVVLNPEWLGTHIIGMLLSAEYLTKCRQTGIYSIDDFAPLYPEIGDINDLLHILDTLQLCSPTEGNNPESEFEFPAFILKETPKDCWKNDKKNYVYGGMKILPMRGMERSLQSTFPRIQTALRRSMHDFQDPMDADLTQWTSCSKLCSGAMESLIRLKGDAVEILVRGPSEMAASCFYFMEDIANMVEHTASEVAPGISLERHFFSPNHLKDHRPNPAIFPPEVIMDMQQKEQMVIKNSDDEEENFIDVVCFGSREVASVLTLGIDVGVAQLQMASRCELAALLDPSDAMGRDWSILAVKLNLTDQLPEVDSTGQSLSRTDQLLAEWALQCPENATVGQLCSILEELGRKDAKDALYRTVPLYIFAPLDDGTGMETLIEGDCNDSGVYPHVNV